MKLKGQFNVEYMFSLVVFILVVIYLSAQISNTIPQYHQKSIETLLYNDAFVATEILIKDPNNGFAFSPYNLSATKIISFENYCKTNYEDTKKKINLVDREFQLLVYVNSTLNFVCGMTHIPEGISSVNLERYGITDGQITKVNIMVW